MKIRAVVHKAEEGGFWAEVPSLPGCATQGETMEELRSNLCEAIEGRLAVPVDGRLAALRTAIDEGDASGVAEGDVFARVLETLNLPQKPR
jgi:predicted RNase H-like HicB family nuclease